MLLMDDGLIYFATSFATIKTSKEAQNCIKGSLEEDGESLSGVEFPTFRHLAVLRARKKWGLTLSKKAYVCPWFMFHSTQSQPNLSILVKSDLLQQKTNIAWSTKKCHDSSWKKEYHQEAQFSSSFWSCQNKRKEILHLVLSTRVRRPPNQRVHEATMC